MSEILLIRKYRHVYAQFRSGVHMLELERGRYTGVPRHQRLCKLCARNEVENELHFMFNCPVYDDLRVIYVPLKYRTNINLHKLHLLLSSKNEETVKNVACYLYYAFQRRQYILDVLA